MACGKVVWYFKAGANEGLLLSDDDLSIVQRTLDIGSTVCEYYDWRAGKEIQDYKHLTLQLYTSDCCRDKYKAKMNSKRI